MFSTGSNPSGEPLRTADGIDRSAWELSMDGPPVSPTPPPAAAQDQLSSSGSGQTTQQPIAEAADRPTLPPVEESPVTIAEFARVLAKWSGEIERMNREMRQQDNTYSYNVHQSKIAEAVKIMQVNSQVGEVFATDMRLLLSNNVVSAGISATFNAAADIYNGAKEAFNISVGALNTAAEIVRSSIETTIRVVAEVGKELLGIAAKAAEKTVNLLGDIAKLLFEGKLTEKSLKSTVDGFVSSLTETSRTKFNNAVNAINRAIDAYNAQREQYNKLGENFKQAGLALEEAGRRANDQFKHMMDPIDERNRRVAEIEQRFGIKLPSLNLVDFFFPTSFPTAEFKELGSAIGGITMSFDLTWEKNDIKVTPDVLTVDKKAVLIPGITVKDVYLPKLNVTLPSFESLQRLGGAIKNSVTAFGTYLGNLFTNFMSGLERYVNQGLMPVVQKFLGFMEYNTVFASVVKSISERRGIGGSIAMNPQEKAILALIMKGQGDKALEIQQGKANIEKQSTQVQIESKNAELKAEKASSKKQEVRKAEDKSLIEPKTPEEIAQTERINAAMGVPLLEKIVGKDDQAKQAADSFQLIALGLANTTSPAALLQPVLTVAQLNSNQTKNYHPPLAPENKITQSIIATNYAEAKIGVTKGIEGNPSATALAALEIAHQTKEFSSLSPEEQAKMLAEIKALIDLLLMMLATAQQAIVIPGQMKKILAHALSTSQPSSVGADKLYKEAGADSLRPENNASIADPIKIAQIQGPYMEQAITQQLTSHNQMSTTDASAIAKAVVKHVAIQGAVPLKAETLPLPASVDAAAITEQALQAVKTVLYAVDFKNELINAIREERRDISKTEVEKVAEQSVRTLFGIALSGNPQLPPEHQSALATMQDAIKELSRTDNFMQVAKTVKSFLDADQDISAFAREVVSRAQEFVTLTSMGIADSDIKPAISIPV